MALQMPGMEGRGLRVEQFGIVPYCFPQAVVQPSENSSLLIFMR